MRLHNLETMTFFFKSIVDTYVEVVKEKRPNRIVKLVPQGKRHICCALTWIPQGSQLSFHMLAFLRQDMLYCNKEQRPAI
jgi:hypothetical protein